MPELLQIITEDFELTVWSRDISARQQTHDNTLKNHGQQSQAAGVRLSSAALTLRVQGEEVEGEPVSVLELPRPLFFENTEYQFEWIFHEDVTSAELTHRSRQLNDGFRFAPARGSMPARLTGNVQTGNDVGWLRLPVSYTRHGRALQHALAVEVLPTKMLLQRDLPAMYEVIDQSFPLWRFSLVEKTGQDAASSRQRGNFPLLWLAQFARLREKFEQGLQVIRLAPHSRLQADVRYSRADRLKGRIPHRLGERVRDDLASQRTDRRYRVEKKRLSVDTPENRFIKMVVSKSRQQLAGLEQRLRLGNQVPDRQRLSDAFLQELNNWQKPMQKMLDRSFLQEVGDYTGMNGESLVLQQKTGYSSVYRVWQELKFYLDVLAGQSEVSMKSVAEIYEIWCFLRIRQMLLDDLGFEEVAAKKSGLELNEFFEYRLQDGFAGAFRFKRSDGVTASLAHEPRFTRKGVSIRSYLVTQKPDIVLEACLPGGTRDKERRFIWLFDAKYRIKTERNQYEEDDIDSTDFVPDDAINQMHRYRDALIALHDSSTDNQRKSRPVFGALALYPGHFAQDDYNPYADAIKEIGIGAFPLLPGASSDGWLLDYLRSQIGDTGNYTHEMADALFVQDAARIPVHGMKQVLYPDLCMTISLGGARERDRDYFERFEQGTAGWYHMPQATFVGKFEQHVVEEIRYLALARTSPSDSNSKQIDRIWPVLGVRLGPRHAITAAMAGKASTSDTAYYLFKLGRPLTLHQPIYRVPHAIRPSMKLTTLKLLEQQSLFSQLPTVYPHTLNQP